MSDWLTQVTTSAKHADERETQALHAQATDELRSAGVPEDNMHQYDLAAMKRDAVPMDGRFSNQYAMEGQRLVGRRDARDGSAMFGAEVEDPDLFDMVPPIGEVKTSEAGIVAGGIAHGVKAGAETAAAVAYAIPRGIVNFSADVVQAFDENADVVRMPTYEEIGGSAPTGPVDDLARDMVPFFVGFNKVNSAMRAVIEGPKKAAAAAGAAMDFVLSDPLEGSLLQDAYNAFFSAENDMAARAQMEDFAENNPLAVRGMAALEGAALGVAVDGAGQFLRSMGEKAKVLRQQLFKMGDKLEETAAMGLARATHAPGAGLDASGEKWLTVWMASRIMKGQSTVDDALYKAVADTGATQAQVHAAWNAAARQSQQARMQATERWVAGLESRWTLFHGTRHKIEDGFDLQRSGTGEGGAAYGPGVYLAENPDVAGTYRTAGRSPGSADEGYLYTVTLPDEARARMVDYDKSIGEQSPEIQRTIMALTERYGIDESYIGEGGSQNAGQWLQKLHARIASDIDRAERPVDLDAARVMRRELMRGGISGARYADAGSRGTGEGTSNVVLYDPSLAQIERRAD